MVDDDYTRNATKADRLIDGDRVDAEAAQVYATLAVAAALRDIFNLMNNAGAFA